MDSHGQQKYNDGLERYSRQIMLAEIGEEGQRRLRDARVLIVGLGGLGSPVALYLAGAGVGTMVLADPDTVSVSNLQRQVLYSEDEVDMSKVLCAARRIKALNGDIDVVTVPEGLTADNGASLVARVDLVLDCTDNYPVRYLIDDLCHACRRPWIHASIGAFTGQIALFTPEGSDSDTMTGISDRTVLRYSDLYPDRDALCALPRQTAGVLGAVPGVVGAIQSSEAVKYLCGIPSPLRGALFNIDLLTLETDIIRF